MPVVSGKFIRPGWMKSLFSVFITCLLCAWSGDVPAAEKSAGDTGTGFRFAFGAVVQEPEGLKLRSIGERAVMKAGDKLKMLIEIEQKCFVYVVYRDAQGTLSTLFPYPGEPDDGGSRSAGRYFVPRQDAWFELDNHKGSEIFYLIASDRRLNQLEYLLDQYRSAESGRKDTLAEQAVAEIEGIEEDRRELTAFAERSLGRKSARGFERAQGRDPSDISVFSREIKFTGTFLKTFTVEHR